MSNDINKELEAAIKNKRLKIGLGLLCAAAFIGLLMLGHHIYLVETDNFTMETE